MYCINLEINIINARNNLLKSEVKMAYKKSAVKIFTVTNELTVFCQWQNTSYGFRHLGWLRRNGYEIARAKATYYNRTWESFQYQSVIKDLYASVKSGLTPAEDAAFKQLCEHGYVDVNDKPADPFQAMTGLFAIASLLADNKADEVALKTRALESTPGINLPDDFKTLPLEERERRINSAFNVIKNK